jgi:hypothetical protein
MVPGQGLEPAYGGYNLQHIVLSFKAVCACGLFLVAPLMHFTIGTKVFDERDIAMDNHFFLNGNKWSGDVPDGFEALEEELLEGEYDEEEEAE